MPGEHFAAERGKIQAVEKSAKEKENKDLELAIQKNADVFDRQVNDAGQACFDVLAKINDPQAKADIKNNYDEIPKYLLAVAEKGNAILTAGQKEGAEKQISVLVAGLKTFMEKAKTELPQYQLVEKNRAEFAKQQQAMEKIRAMRDVEQLQKMPAAERAKMVSEVAPKIRALDDELQAINLGGASQELSLFYRKTATEIALAHGELGEFELLCLNQKQREDANLNGLNEVNISINSLGKIGVNFEMDASTMSKGAEELLNKAAEAIVKLKAMKQDELGSDYKALHKLLVQKAQNYIMKAEEITVYCAKKESLEKSDFLKKYFTFGANGKFIANELFARMPAEEQQRIAKKVDVLVNELKLKIQLETEEKTALPFEKKLISGKQKLAAGDFVTAKNDFLDFYKKETGSKENANQLQLAECLDFLKQIAKMEIAEMSDRLKSMQQSMANPRYEWGIDPTQDSLYGTKNRRLAQIAVERMGALMVRAEKMIDSGEALTIDEVRAQFLAMKPKDDTDPIAGFQHGFAEFGVKDRALFDVFQQQQMLNEKDPVKRKENIAALGKLMREKGYGENAKQFFEKYFKDELDQSREKITFEDYRKEFFDGSDGEKNRAKIEKQLARWEKDFKEKNGGKAPSDEEKAAAKKSKEDAMIQTDYDKAIKLTTHRELSNQVGANAKLWQEVYSGVTVLQKFGQDEYIGEGMHDDEEWNALPAQTTMAISVTAGSAALASLLVAGAGAATVAGMGATLGQATTAGFLSSTIGSGVAFTGSLAVESVGFVAAQDQLNHLLNNGKFGSDFENPADFAKAVGHNMVVLGALKGMGAGFGGLEKTYGVPASLAGKAAWSILKTILEGGVLTGISAGSELLAGEKFTATDAVKSFGDNIVFSVGIAGAHAFAGEGAAPEAKKKVSKEEAVARGAVVEAAKADLAASKALEKAKIANEATGGRKNDRAEYKAEMDAAKAKLEADRAVEKAQAAEKAAVEKLDAAVRAEADLAKKELAELRAKAEQEKKWDDPKMQLEIKAAEIRAHATEREIEISKLEKQDQRDFARANPELPLEIAKLSKNERENMRLENKIEKYKKMAANQELPPEVRERAQFLVEQFEKAKLNGAELSNAARALVEEHRVVEIDDPMNPGQKIKIDLFEDFNSKNFAYTSEMVALMNNHERLMREGPKIIKHGGDEIVILHAGPDGKVQMFFGDIGNMGPTNEFALRMKGNDANMVDLYLRDFAQVVKARFKPGQNVDGPALLSDIKNSLSKKYFGIETEVEFNALKNQWNLDGSWADYQQNMGNARILAGFRSSSRGLQKEFIAEQEAAGKGNSGNPKADIDQFSQFVESKIKALDNGNPPLAEVLRANLDAMAEAGALNELLPSGIATAQVVNKAKLKEILEKSDRSVDENMILYYALQRVNANKIAQAQGVDVAAVRDRFKKIRQVADDSTLMDFQMGSVDLPQDPKHRTGIPEMNLLINVTLEYALHEAKAEKGVVDIKKAENPFDQNGNIRADLPNHDALQRAYEGAKNDRKAAVIESTTQMIRQAQQKLDAIKNQIDKIEKSPILTEADRAKLLSLKADYNAIVQKINSEKFRDAETGADRPGKFAQDIDVWMRDRNGNKIDRNNQMYREFVLDMHNTGAINAQKGYAATDAAMRTIAERMMQKFPAISSIVRTGGGAFKLVFMDAALLRKPDGTILNISEHRALIETALVETNAAVQEQLRLDTKTVIDGTVRDATGKFRSRSEGGGDVGMVSVKEVIDIEPTEFAAKTAEIAPPRSLYKIYDKRRNDTKK